jgi:hypothetical protein
MRTYKRLRPERYVETVNLRLTRADLRNVQRLMNLQRCAAGQREVYLNLFLSRALADECRFTFEDEEVQPFPGRVPSDW